MFSLLLALIYLAFISLGLPDSLLGAAWPIMYHDFGVELSFMGIVSMIISAGTILSSLLSDRLTRRLSAGPVTALSVGMTAVSLFGFSTCTAAWQLCLWAIPYGLGAGAVDAALNNYVALHYTARHMSWLHAFWGIGASVSPNVMAWALASRGAWPSGYRAVSLVQIVLTAVLLFSLPLWKKNRSTAAKKQSPPPAAMSLADTVKLRGVLLMMLAFFGYCAMESTAGQWASSYLVEYRGVDPTTAANFASFYYIGLMLGRFANGLVADRMGDRRMIRLGILGALVGIGMMMLPLDTNILSLVGLVVAGVGSAPIYPSIIHATPKNFGAEHSQSVIGVQMAAAYTGSTFMPPLFGLLAQHINIALYPFYLALFALLMLLMTEILNRKIP